jgi:2-polyprenyl-3-methyl-5-hydroxy-6-metoxy-1,4-benzoquinol methylase
MSQDVQDYYNNHAQKEWERLDGALCKIEFASTLHLINKYFPKQGRVCDIGGGPGRYTVELARRGYQVTLFDLSEEEIQFAGSKLNELELQAEQLLVGDAIDLSRLDSDSFDAALLMGPMYHVIDAEKRAGILRELARILKPGGIAIVAYLNTWGIIRTGIIDFPDWYRDLAFLRALTDEQIFRGSVFSRFTECYWSTPEVALREVETAGFKLVSYAGSESFAVGMAPLLEVLMLENPIAYANIVQVAAETCELPQYRDNTDHLHIVVRRYEDGVA